MGTIVSLRKDLLGWRVSRSEFAKRCGLTSREFDAALERGGETDPLMDVAWRKLIEERSGMESSGSRIMESMKESSPDAPEEGGVERRCQACRPVRNPNLLLVRFDDGSEGRLRKNREFVPREGISLEVEPSEEEGYWKLVGRYRDNGVRL